MDALIYPTVPSYGIVRRHRPLGPQQHEFIDTGIIRVRCPLPPREAPPPGSEPPPHNPDDDVDLTESQFVQLLEAEFHGSSDKTEREGATDVYVVYPDHSDPRWRRSREPAHRLPFLAWFLGAAPDDAAPLRALDLAPHGAARGAGFCAVAGPWPPFRASERAAGVFVRVGSLHAAGRARLERIAQCERPRRYELVCADADTSWAWLRRTLEQAVQEGLFDETGAMRAVQRAQRLERETPGTVVEGLRAERGLSEQQVVIIFP
ncbi:hypothetical protein PsYK624_116960 [Phanerochaete sordida]|uniref:Uncharacterized protein n=1 Tax=Phanerochaete sordida TaxID=48140 RepID=A0A9P3GID8_9APHY|nr:hypothetical protein PsYK624_116960 [Phanerochaete sordida]